MRNQEYIQLFNQLLKECDTVYHTAAVKGGLSDCAFWILYTLQDTDHTYTQSEIGGLASMPRQTVNSALKKLEREGFLTLEHTEDKLRKRICLTEKGQAFSEKHIKPVMDAEIRICASFPNDEKDLLLRTFRSFVEKMNNELKDI